jgi:hypothetical protein
MFKKNITFEIPHHPPIHYKLFVSANIVFADFMAICNNELNVEKVNISIAT